MPCPSCKAELLPALSEDKIDFSPSRSWRRQPIFCQVSNLFLGEIETKRFLQRGWHTKPKHTLYIDPFRQCLFLFVCLEPLRIAQSPNRFTADKWTLGVAPAQWPKWRMSDGDVSTISGASWQVLLHTFFIQQNHPDKKQQVICRTESILGSNRKHAPGQVKYWNESMLGATGGIHFVLYAASFTCTLASASPRKEKGLHVIGTYSCS